MAEEGVLLYYSFVDLQQHQQQVQAWMLQLCQQLQLRGRVRVAQDGINATLGGPMSALRQHITAVKSHPALAAPIDFKLAPLPPTCSEAAVVEAGFDQLAVTCCKVKCAPCMHFCSGKFIRACAALQVVYLASVAPA